MYSCAHCTITGEVFNAQLLPNRFFFFLPESCRCFAQMFCFHLLVSNITHFFHREMSSEKSCLAVVSSKTVGVFFCFFFSFWNLLSVVQVYQQCSFRSRVNRCLLFLLTWSLQGCKQSSIPHVSIFLSRTMSESCVKILFLCLLSPVISKMGPCEQEFT